MKWYTISEGRIDQIQNGNKPVGEGDWEKAPDGWKGNHGDKVEWFDKDMQRISDDELIKQGKRVDNRGRVFNVNDRSNRLIHNLDDELREDETKEPPIENETFQFFDKTKKKWVVDTEKKEVAEKEQRIAEKQSAIEDAERRIQRSTIAKLAGIATSEDEQIFSDISAEITRLREEKLLLSA
ncbi:MAG: hypothetical protein LBI28_12780 [Treponema sp.]|jgi:hypothetical protein|nr:hypothetical protein [Treponema sp.]